MTPLQEHLLRIGAWGALSLVAGVAAWRRRDDPWWRQFAIQMTLWGAIDAVLAVVGWTGDPPSAAFLWVNVGLDVGYVGVAVTLLLVGRRFASGALRGAGCAVIPQGLVLLASDLVLLRAMGAW